MAIYCNKDEGKFFAVMDCLNVLDSCRYLLETARLQSSPIKNHLIELSVVRYMSLYLDNEIEYGSKIRLLNKSYYSGHKKIHEWCCKLRHERIAHRDWGKMDITGMINSEGYLTGAYKFSRASHETLEEMLEPVLKLIDAVEKKLKEEGKRLYEIVNAEDARAERLDKENKKAPAGADAENKR